MSTHPQQAQPKPPSVRRAAPWQAAAGCGAKNMRRVRCFMAANRARGPKNFGMYLGQPQVGSVHSVSVTCTGSACSRYASISGAEREAPALANKPRSPSARAQRRLTPRSKRGPTANCQARLQVRFIILPPGLALCRRSRLNSNVRPRNNPNPSSNRCQRLTAWTEQPRRINALNFTSALATRMITMLKNE